MSGSGGGIISNSGGGSAFGGIGSGDSFNCALVNIQTVLNSPDPAVLSELTPGTELMIELRGQSLVAVDRKGRIAGSVTPPELPKLIACLEDGYSYVAIVEKVAGGRCVVIIRVRGVK